MKRKELDAECNGVRWLPDGKHKGVRKHTSDKWGSEIQNPISGGLIWLGCFDTVEEASRVYEMKRKELYASCIGVRRLPGNKWTALIESPISHQLGWMGLYSTAEEASHAFEMKKLELGALTNSVDFNQNQAPESGNSVKDTKDGGESSTKEKVSHPYVESKPGLITGECSAVQQCKSNEQNGIQSSVGNQQKRDWLRAFNTANDASNAYRTNRMEFDTLTKFSLTSHTHPSSDNNGEKIPKKESDSYPHVESRPAIVTREIGTPLRKSGKWTARIMDPIQRKQVRLGTYNTAEEASNAYQMKKKEFDALTKLKKTSQMKMKTDVLAALTDSTGAQQSKGGRWSARIYDPRQKKDISLGAYNTAEEASNAYQMKRKEFDALTKSSDLSSRKCSRPNACYSSTSSESVMDSSRVSNKNFEDTNAYITSLLAANANEPKKVVDSGILGEQVLKQVWTWS